MYDILTIIPYVFIIIAIITRIILRSRGIRALPWLAPLCSIFVLCVCTSAISYIAQGNRYGPVFKLVILPGILWFLISAALASLIGVLTLIRSKALSFGLCAVLISAMLICGYIMTNDALLDAKCYDISDHLLVQLTLLYWSDFVIPAVASLMVFIGYFGRKTPKEPQIES